MVAIDPDSARSQPVSTQGGLRPGDIDLSDPRTFAAGVPHEYFRMLREEAPVQWQEECEIPVFLPGPGYWALTRYEDIVFVSKHPEVFSSAVGTSALNEVRPLERSMAREQLIQMDPPSPTEVRKLMNGQFKPCAVMETEAHLQNIVFETLDLSARLFSAVEFAGVAMTALLFARDSPWKGQGSPVGA